MARTFAAQARLLHAAKGNVLGGNDAYIDTDHAVFQTFTDAKNSAHIAAVKITGQTKLCVVGGINGFLLSFEFENWGKRTKGFLTGAQHV